MENNLSQYAWLTSPEADNKAKEAEKKAWANFRISPTPTRVNLKHKFPLMKSGTRQQRFISKQGPAI